MISGTSCGGVIAALVGTRQDAELLQVLRDATAHRLVGSGGSKGSNAAPTHC